MVGQRRVGGGVAPGFDDGDEAEVVVGVDVRDPYDFQVGEDLVGLGGAVHAADLAEGGLACVEEVRAAAWHAHERRGDVAVFGGDRGAGAEGDDFGVARGDVGFGGGDGGEEGRVLEFCARCGGEGLDGAGDVDGGGAGAECGGGRSRFLAVRGVGLFVV